MLHTLFFSWQKDDLSIIESPGKPWLPNGPLTTAGALVLPSVSLTDAGEYRCTANNSAGAVARNTLLVVRKPTIVQVKYLSQLQSR